MSADTLAVCIIWTFKNNESTPASYSYATSYIYSEYLQLKWI